MRNRRARVQISMLMTVVGACSLLGACTAGGSDPTGAESQSSDGPTSAPEGPLNPLDAITDPASDDFVAQDVTVLLDEQGSGPADLELSADGGLPREVVFYVACSPHSEFKVSAFDNFFSGPCSSKFENSGSIPVGANATTAVALEIPGGVEFHIVAIAAN